MLIILCVSVSTICVTFELFIGYTNQDDQDGMNIQLWWGYNYTGVWNGSFRSGVPKVCQLPGDLWIHFCYGYFEVYFFFFN